MIILVDAYNLIKSISRSSHISERAIKDWIYRFKEYVNLRHNEAILVFDAGPGLYEMTEYYGKVTVLYSGQMKSADDIIIEWLQQHKHRDILLVTSDREVRDGAKDLGVLSVSSEDFYQIFQHVMDREVAYEKKIATTIKKTTEEQNGDLDRLMEQGSRNIITVKKVDEPLDIRVRDGRKASKIDRQLLKKIEKI